MLAHSILSSSILKDADEKKIKRVIPKASNKIIDQTVARLYIAHPNPQKWQYTGLSGAIVLVEDLLGKSFFLKLVDIEGQRGVLWDQELYVDFKYYQDRTFFHSFELEECLAGLLFEDKSEAAHFFKRVTQRHKHASKETANNKAAVPRNGPIRGPLGSQGSASPRTSSGAGPPPPPPPSSGPQAPSARRGASGPSMGPRGDLSGTHRRRGKQLYYDDEPPVEWRPLYKDLANMGITEDMIAANTQFIKDFIIKQGGPLVGLEPPLPRRYAPQVEASSVASGPSTGNRAPPPPPPSAPQASMAPSSSPAVPPPPPASRASAAMADEADGVVADGSGSGFKIGGLFKGFSKPTDSASVSPVSGTSVHSSAPPAAPPAVPPSAPPSAPPNAPPMAPPGPVHGTAPPYSESTDAPAATSVEEQAAAIPVARRNVPPPFEGAGSRVSETVITRTNKAPPPMPPREAPQESGNYEPRGRNTSGGSHGEAPPPRPARPRPGSGDSHTSSGSSGGPPLPPSRKSGPPPTPSRRVPLPPAAPVATRPRAATPPHEEAAPSAPPRPARPQHTTDSTPPPAPRRPTEPSQVQTSAPPAAPPAAPPRFVPPSTGPPPEAPPRPTPGPAGEAAPAAPRRPGPASPGGAPPPAPLMPPSFGGAPPAAPRRPEPASSGGAPPPAPPMPSSFGGGAPPAAPPPPPSFAPPSSNGGDNGEPPSMLSNDLLSSITQAGIGSLKKVDKTHLERPSVIQQEARGETPRAPAGAPPGGGGDLAGALAAALSARKSKVTASDDEAENEDDWD